MKTTIIIYWLNIAIGAVSLIRSTMVDNEESRVIWTKIDDAEASLSACRNVMQGIEDAK